MVSGALGQIGLPAQWPVRAELNRQPEPVTIQHRIMEDRIARLLLT